MRRLFFSIVIMAVLLSGCGSYQVNDRMYVRMTGISSDEDGFALTVQGFDTSSSEPETVPEYKAFSGHGTSISQAADDIERQSGKKLYLGQCQLLFADDGIITDKEMINELADCGIPSACSVLYSAYPERSVEQYDEGDKIVGADKIIAETEKYREAGSYCPVTLKELYVCADHGHSAVVPNYENSISGMAVADKTGKVTFMNDSESKVFNLLSEKQEITMYPVGCCVCFRDPEVNAYLYSGAEQPELEIMLNVRGRITESGECGINVREELRSSAADIISRAYNEDFVYRLRFLDNIPEPSGERGLSASVNVNILNF